MSFYYHAITNPINNTETNRNKLLNTLTLDPSLSSFSVESVESINDGYTTVIAFNNDIWSGTEADRLLLEKIVNIIMNENSPSTTHRRSVVTTSIVPSSIYDSNYNFSVGSTWFVTESKQTYRCYNNQEGNAIWTATIPFTIVENPNFPDGSIVQYKESDTFWHPQPGKWASITIASSTMKTDGINEPVLSGTNKIYTFSSNVMKELFFTAVLPHRYYEGTNIIPCINYVPTTGNPGSIVWGLDYVWCNTDDIIGSPIITTITTLNTNTANKNTLITLNEISGENKNISSFLLCRIYRDATNINDDYPDDTGLLAVSFKYRILGLGSSEIDIK